MISFPKNRTHPPLIPESPARRVGPRAGVRGGLKSDEESDRGLCEVGYFVEIQVIECEIGNLVHQAAIFRAYSEVACQIEIDAPTVDKCRLGLALDSIH